MDQFALYKLEMLKKSSIMIKLQKLFHAVIYEPKKTLKSFN